MATAGNPAAGMMARSIIDQLVSKGRSGTSIPQPTGTEAPDQTKQMLGSQLSELRQADPQAVQRALQQMKKQIVDLIPQVAFTIPGMNKHLPNLLKTVEAALKEVEQASNTMGAVNPIQSSMASPSNGVGQQPQGGGFPF